LITPVAANVTGVKVRPKRPIKKGYQHRMRLFCLLLVLLAGLASPSTMTAPPALVVSAGGATRQFTRDELLARHDAATLAVSNDPAYGCAVSYRAVPLRALLAALPPDAVAPRLPR
jgi:hypothetical protein